jgi:predicted transposase YdaD
MVAGRRGLLHVELQTRVEGDIGERVADYALRLLRRDHLPVSSVVVFLRPVRATPQPRFVLPGLPGLGDERLVDTFTIVRLWEIPQARVLDVAAPALWPLAALMAGSTVKTTIEVAQRLAAAPEPLEERRELTGLLITLAGLRLPRERLLAAIRRNPMIDELLRESSVAEEFIEEGFKRGIEQGREQGREEGRSAGVRDAVLLLLEGRFGALDPALVAAIERADKPTLEQVLLHGATDTSEQLRARLGL